MEAPRPLGYWLRHLHNLLEKQFDATLADLGVHRRHWQILHTLSRGEASRDDLTAALAPFWTEGAPDLDTCLAELADRGWTPRDLPSEQKPVALTDEGHAAHAGIAERVHATRAVVTRGLTAEQYTETLRVLSLMADNVETELAARQESPGAHLGSGQQHRHLGTADTAGR